MVSAESRLYNPAGYHTGSIWPLFTGWAMLGAMRQGEPAIARTFLGRNASLYTRFSLGHVPEVLHGNTGRPAGVCDHQAWSDAMVVLGAVIPPDRPRDLPAFPHFPAIFPHSPPPDHLKTAQNA